MAETINNAQWMDWVESLMGGASRQTATAALPPDRYYCLLDELPLHLVPQSARRLLRWDDLYSGDLGSGGRGLDIHRKQPLFLNRECVVCPGGQLPEEIRDQEELVSGFAQCGTIAWVRHPVSRKLLPFWLGPRLEAMVIALKPRNPAPSLLRDDDRALLFAAGILVSDDHDSRFRQKWREVVDKSSQQFRESGYAPLPDLIHPFHVAALRRYYRYLTRTGAVHLGDPQSPRRYVAYNEPVARFFHHHIAAALSAVAGEPLKPSYVYMASYLSGAELKKHTDRPQCEFSVTFCLDFSPEPALETRWPIQLDTPAGVVCVYQALGDGLAYRGTRLPHYRGVLGKGLTSTSIFFHYVPVDFSGPLD